MIREVFASIIIGPGDIGNRLLPWHVLECVNASMTPPELKQREDISKHNIVKFRVLGIAGPPILDVLRDV